MKIDRSKLERQKQIGREFWQRGGIGSFLAATGFGKSFTAILVIMALQRRYPSLFTLVVVPSGYLKQQWESLLAEHRIYRVVVKTVQSITGQHRKQAKVDFMILDEMHAYTSPVFSEIFDCINYRWLLGMTATLDDRRGNTELLHQKCPVFHTVSLEECLKKGWIAPFSVFNLGLELSEQSRTEYELISGIFNHNFGLFGHNLGLTFKCLGDPKFRTKFANQRGWDPGRVAGTAKKAVKAMNERKDFLNNHPALIDAATKILHRYGDQRKFITFSQNSAFADRLTKNITQLKAVSYHNDIKSRTIGGVKYSGKKLRKKLIELYNKGQIDVVNAVKSLDQGTNIEAIDSSIVCSGPSSFLQAVQRTGRITRKLPDKRACEINLYFKRTQSEKWLKKRQQKHPASTIKHISDINEIVL